MSSESIQRATVYTGLNLAVSALYYFGVKERYIPGAVLNKQAAVIGLSIITQASHGLLIDHDNRSDEPELIRSLFIHGAAITILGIGSYLSGVPLKTTVMATFILGLTQAQITDYMIHRDDPSPEEDHNSTFRIPTYVPPTFPRPASTSIEEARQVLSKMKASPLKASANITILLTEALIGNAQSVIDRTQNLFIDQPAQRVALLCGLAEISDEVSLITQAFQTAEAIGKDYPKAACMIRIAYAAKKLAPGRDNFDEYLNHCPRDNPEIQRWVNSFLKHTGDYAPKPIDDPGEHHMTRCAYHLQQRNIEEALAATREDIWNLYWRVEALCDIAKREHF